MRRQRQGRARGFTLLEAVVAASLLFVALGMAMTLFLNVDREVAGAVSSSDLDMRMNRTMGFLRTELGNLRGANEASNQPVQLTDTGLSPGNYTRLQFRPVIGYTPSTQQLQYDSTRTLEILLDPAEVNNDQDDNGNGLIDEGILVYTVNGVATTIATGIAINAEDYGAGAVGQDFGFSFLPGNGPTFTNGDRALNLSLTFLTRDFSHHGETPAVLLRAQTLQFSFRN
ncbi:MAG: hypothetical protein AB7N76_30620 [Planctomycetota bacterium]